MVGKNNINNDDNNINNNDNGTMGVVPGLKLDEKAMKQRMEKKTETLENIIMEGNNEGNSLLISKANSEKEIMRFKTKEKINESRNSNFLEDFLNEDEDKNNKNDGNDKNDNNDSKNDESLKVSKDSWDWGSDSESEPTTPIVSLKKNNIKNIKNNKNDKNDNKNNNNFKKPKHLGRK